ncbi:MAG: Trm112 family protein [bacterium]
MDRKLLEILVCPITKQPVSLLDPARLGRVNALIAQGALQTLDGAKIEHPLQAALITRNGATLYRIDDDIPVMLEEQSIPCEQIADW